MKLFTVGPVEMHPETLEVSSRQLPYFRTEEFSKVILDSERLFKESVHADEGSRVLFLTASGTGAMEATVMNMFTSKDRLLIIDGGSFGHRFCEICKIHGIQFESIPLAFGETLTKAHLEQFDNKGFTGMLVNLDETSVGQLYDLSMISGFCEKNGMHLVVDAISAYLADELDVSKNKVDALIVSSQKALSLSPGLSIIMLSEEAIGMVQDNDPHSLYFDLKAYLKDGERGQTPFTPAVGILLELNEALNRVSSKGIDNVVRESAEKAEYFRNAIKGLPLELPEFPMSNAVTPVIFKNGGAYDTFLRLMDDYGIVLTPSGGDNRDRILRVGHLGNLTTEDYDDLVRVLKEVLL